MREGFPGLVHAVQTALGRDLDPKSVEDRTLLYDGCFLLNFWGDEPRYRYE
ncbi:MAG: hypothetical protein IJ026_07825 [Candidatus Methanomethylophilaceae archaeon]|nr:hypothetical protein [Candidatus Methanomethylophilaceae archaeon]